MSRLVLVDDFLEVPWEGKNITMLLLIEGAVSTNTLVVLYCHLLLRELGLLRCYDGIAEVEGRCLDQRGSVKSHQATSGVG